MTHNPRPHYSHVKKADDLAVVISEDFERVVVLENNADQPVLLTGTGAAIWHYLDEFSTVSEISQRLATEYSVSLSDVFMHVDSFISDLVSQRILVSAPTDYQRVAI